MVDHRVLIIFPNKTNDADGKTHRDDRAHLNAGI